MLFIGCVESSELFLKSLLEQKVNIVGVITKKQSKYNADFVDLAPICQDNKIEFLYVNNINNNSVYEFVQKLCPDIGFCLGWSQLLGKKILNMFPKGVIGFHPAALPQNKGRHPLIWALALGLQETASSFFLLDEYADTGKVISQKKVPILYEDTARTLYDKVMVVAKKQLVELWIQICNDDIHFIKSCSQGNIWRKRNENDGKIDWRMSSKNIYNLVRALSKPYVGASFEYNKIEYKVWKVRELDDIGNENIEPGKILKVGKNNIFIVKTGSGLIEVIYYDQCFQPQIGMYL